MGLCVFSLLIYLMMIVRLRVLYLIIFIQSEVWPSPICHCLGHETMVCTVCLSIFLQMWCLYNIIMNAVFQTVSLTYPIASQTTHISPFLCPWNSSSWCVYASAALWASSVDRQWVYCSHTHPHDRGSLRGSVHHGILYGSPQNRPSVDCSTSGFVVPEFPRGLCSRSSHDPSAGRWELALNLCWMVLMNTV